MPAAVEVFVSYARQDERFRKELDTHLSVLKHEGTISVWHDREIAPGEAWGDEIDAHLRSAQVIVALVSASFLASDYCYGIEMARALERHNAGEARLIPVILRPVEWQASPLGNLQALPTDAKPVASWKNRDDAFADIVRGIRRTVVDLRSSPAPPRQSKPRPRPSDRFRPAVWNVPHSRNRNFTGRDGELQSLELAFSAREEGTCVQVLSGLAGVGKTQIALEYVYRNNFNYSLVWWISADESTSVAADFSRLAERFGLAAGHALDQAEIVNAVRAWLEDASEWLLVFDDARDPRDLSPYLPQSTLGHVLITSRNPNWRGVGHPIAVKVPASDDAVRFLLRRTGQDDADAAAKLASSLGQLPLALEQAGAYIEEKGKTLAAYLDLFRSHERELTRRATTRANHPAGVEAVWELSFREVKTVSPAAGELLELCAFLGPDDIPIKLITQHPEPLPPRLREIITDPLACDDAVAALRRYSLVETTERGLSVHALVQAVARDRLDDAVRQSWAAAAVHLMHDLFLFERDSVERWREAARLLPHVIAATTHADALGTAVEMTARLRDQAGLDLRRGVELARATELFLRAVEADEVTYGPDHSRVAATRSNLASVLEAAGDLGKAQTQYEAALRIDERAYGVEDPTVATDASKLAGVLRAQGNLDGARMYYERALAIDDKTFGEAHPIVAADLGDLGDVLRMQADLQGAQNCYERALAIEQPIYGNNHPKVASRIADLGSVRYAASDLAVARALYEEALAITERAYRPNHVAVAERALDLAKVLLAADDTTDAIIHYERAADIFRQELGKGHPRTVTADRTLASLRGESE